MRKTSHDGGDSTSITSGVENEVKKSAMKSKKSSLKRKPPTDSDDTVIEPLLQKAKQKTETAQSAKYFTKGKTDSLQNKEIDSNTQTSASTGFCGTTESLLSIKGSEGTNLTSSLAPIHNYMNTNVFNTHDNSKVNVISKSQILVEIDGTKKSGYNPSPLIFTTAKIHTDGKSKNMEPVQMTPVPILSTIEVSMTKGGSFTTNEKNKSNGSSVTNPVYSPMSLSKDKNEKVTVNSSSIVTSPTTTEVALGKAIKTSTSKLSNNTLVQSSSIEISLPSTTGKSLSTITNTKGNQATIKDLQKAQAKNIDPKIKPINLDKIKNGVTVKTTTTSSSKVNLVDISIKPTKTNQNDTTHKNKLNASSDNKTSANVDSDDSLHFVTNVKTPTSSKKSLGMSNTANNCSTTAANKQLQRQKSTTVETSNVDLKTKPNTESFEDPSAKTQFMSDPKVMNSTLVKDNDKLPKVSLNDTQNLNKKEIKQEIKVTANLTTNVTSISTTEKPTSTPTNISSVPSTTTDCGETTTTALKSAQLNINKTSTATTPIIGATAITKSSATTVGKTSAISTISIANCTELSSMPPESSVGKIELNKIPSVTTAEDIKTTPLSSVCSLHNNKTSTTTTTKSSPVVTSNVIPAMNKPHVTKTPIDTTLITTKSINVTNSKASSNTSQVTEKTEPTAASVSSSAAVKLLVLSNTTPKTKESTAPSASITKTPQIITSTLVTTNKQPITTIGINAKTPSVATLPDVAKPTVSSGSTTTTTLKSPNNYSSQISVSSKPSTTSTTKTIPSVQTLAKTSAASSSTSGATTSAIKSSQYTSSAKAVPKEYSTSAKKPTVTKTQAVTTVKSSPVTGNNSTVGMTKVPHSVATSVPTTISKQSGTPVSKTVLAKTPSVTSTKTPSVTTSSKTSFSSPTTSAISRKPTTTQTSTKLVGIAGSSVPSSTPVLRPSESIKKGGSKSSGNNKDGKFSKA